MADDSPVMQPASPVVIDPPPAPPLDMPPIDDTPVQPPAQPVLTFDQMRTARINEFNLIAQQAGADFLVSYPDLEKLTWPQQVAEVSRWLTAPNDGPFPVCEAINARRGLDFTDFMHRTAAKVAAFQRVAGLIVGERQRLEDAISALVDDTQANRDALAALAWSVTPQDILAAVNG